MFVLDVRRRDVKIAESVPRRPEAKVEREKEARVGSLFRTDFA